MSSAPQPPPDPKPLRRSVVNGIFELPCDGIPRFEVRGSVMAFKVPYSVAYSEVFRLAGGEIEPARSADGKARRIFSKEAVKRITALNQLYRPHALEVIASQQAAADLLKRPAPAIPEPCPPPTAPSS